jgi:aminoglycoside 6'-N-acetyltransferase
MPEPFLHGERVTLRPVTDDDLDPLAEIIASPGVRDWWGEVDEPDRLRDNLRSHPDQHYTAFVIQVSGEIAGWLGVSEETEPEYKSAGLDISLAPRFQGQGLGPEALRTAIGWLASERGHHRFTIDPAVANENAVKAYEAAGFKPIGVARRQERAPDGTWRDALLMDLLAEELD